MSATYAAVTQLTTQTSTQSPTQTITKRRILRRKLTQQVQQQVQQNEQPQQEPNREITPSPELPIIQYNYKMTAHHFVRNVLKIDDGVRCLYFVELYDKLSEALKYNKAGRSRALEERMKKYNLEYYTNIVRIFLVNAMIDAEYVMHKYLKAKYTVKKGNEYYDIVGCTRNKLVDDIREAIKDFDPVEIDPLNIQITDIIKINEANKRKNNGGILKAFKLYANTCIYLFGRIIPIKSGEYFGFNGYNLGALISYYRHKHKSKEDDNEQYITYIDIMISKINDILGYDILKKKSENENKGKTKTESNNDIIAIKKCLLNNGDIPLVGMTGKKKNKTLRGMFNRYMRTDNKYSRELLQFLLDNQFMRLYREHTVNNVLAPSDKARLYTKMLWCIQFFEEKKRRPMTGDCEKLFYDYIDEKFIDYKEYYKNSSCKIRLSTDETNAIYNFIKDNINSDHFYTFPSLLPIRNKLIELIKLYWPDLDVEIQDIQPDNTEYMDDITYDYKNDKEYDIDAYNRSIDKNNEDKLKDKISTYKSQYQRGISILHELKEKILNVIDLGGCYKTAPLDIELLIEDIDELLKNDNTVKDKIAHLEQHIKVVSGLMFKMSSEINDIDKIIGDREITKKSDEQINNYIIEYRDTNNQTQTYGGLLNYTLPDIEYTVLPIKKNEKGQIITQGPPTNSAIGEDELVKLHLHYFIKNDYKLPIRSESAIIYPKIINDVKYNLELNLRRNLEYIVKCSREDTRNTIYEKLYNRLNNEIYNGRLSEVNNTEDDELYNRLIEKIEFAAVNGIQFKDTEIVTVDGNKTDIFKLIQQMQQSMYRIHEIYIKNQKEGTNYDIWKDIKDQTREHTRPHIKNLVINHRNKIKNVLNKYMIKIHEGDKQLDKDGRNSCTSWLGKNNAKYIIDCVVPPLD